LENLAVSALLPPDRLQGLHALAITSDLDRAALLAGIDKRFIASLRQASGRSEQIYQDLQELNGRPRLSDGTVPLVVWLQNAIRLAGPRPEALSFEEILRVLDPASMPAIGGGAAETPAPSAREFSWSEGAVRVYISAAPEDRRFVEMLVKHLTPLSRSGAVDVWHRARLSVGVDIRASVRRCLNEADLILALVSADYLNGDATHQEAQRAIARSTVIPASVVPILARPCDWRRGPFGKLAVLPRNERTITQHSDSDSAYMGVISGIAVVVEDLRRSHVTRPDLPAAGDHEDAIGEKRNGHEALSSKEGDVNRGRSTPDLFSASVARVGAPMVTLFERTTVPRHTYVEPEQLRGIKNALRVLGRGLVVEGPTQIGKSTVIARGLDLIGMTNRCRWLNCLHDADVAAIRQTLVDWKVTDHVVMDNAHLLPPKDTADLARLMRWLADQPSPGGKVTLIGTLGTMLHLIEGQRDLAGRLDLVQMDRQPPARIHAFVGMAEQVANVRFQHKAVIVTEALGSFRLAQEICHASVQQAGLEKVPRQQKLVACAPNLVRADVMAALHVEFFDALARFAYADRGTRTPGACLALLWMLGAEEGGAVKLARAATKFSHLSPALQWIESGELALFLASDLTLNELLQVGAGVLSTRDPRLLYYLRGVPWIDLAERAGIVAAMPAGELQVIVPERMAARADTAARAATGMSPGSEPKTLLDIVPVPWWNPDAVRLRDLLVGAYPDIRYAEMLAQMADVTLGRWAKDGGIEHSWNSLLDVAAAQGKLEALVRTVLGDPNVAAYHTGIRECVSTSVHGCR
jgi:hypothetical protein